jgi:hypothetical protein
MATIKAVPSLTAASGNPPPLVDLSTCFIALGAGIPGVTPNSFGVKLQHLTLSGMGGGANTVTPTSNEPSCGLLGWMAQEQSGPDDITWTGPWINTAFYSGYKSGNSYGRQLHMPSNEGPGVSSLTFYPVIVDGRGLGNGGMRTLEDSTIAMRCGGCSQQPHEPYSVWLTGNTVGLHAHGIHLENDAGGDGFFVDNQASLDLSGITGFADTSHYLAHFSATADASCAMATKVGKNGGVADDAAGFTNGGAAGTAFRYCTAELSGSRSLTTGTESTTQTAGQNTGTPFKVVALNSSGNVVINSAASNNAFGIALGGLTSGSAAEVATMGSTSCIADNATTVNDLAGVSPTTAGDCTDLGENDETHVAVGTQILGRFKTAVSAGANAGVQLFGPGHYGASALAGTSFSAVGGTFSGNVSIGGQLSVAGPWTVSSPIPGTAMGAASTGTSALGISSDGNFYVSANGGTPQQLSTSATSSFFSNLTQEDANSLGEFNGTNPQNFRAYSSYTNSSTWQRTSMGFDVTDNLAVLRSENSSSGSAPGLGFWIGSSVRWAIDSTSTLKPFLNNSINIGTTTLAPQTVYAATTFDSLTQGRLNFELCNDSSTGTSLNFLAKYNSAAPACVVKAGTSDTDGLLGIVSNGSGTTGNAVITYRGYVQCSFDGSTVAGDFVVASTSNAGDCHDGGGTRPAGVQVLGRVESTNTGIGTYAVRMALDSPAGAPIASPAFTGTPTAPTASFGTNSTQLATTALVASGYASGFLTEPIAGNAGVLPSSSANKALLWGLMLTVPVSTSKIMYTVGSNADNTATNNYDVGLYNSAGTLVLNLSAGSFHGSSFAAAIGPVTVSWQQGTTLLPPGKYYLAYYSSLTSAPPTLSSPSATAVTFYKGEAGGTGTCGSTQGSGGFSITPRSGGILPSSITPPADSPSSGACIPAALIY